MDWNFLIRNKESIQVTTDSRKITPGCVFVALKGEHFDGNDYVDQALNDGAAYVIKGDSAMTELQDLARAWRRQLGLPIIGITGTNGKTTTKELLAAVLKTRHAVHYTQGNYNNSLGVPLTLLQLTTHHRLAIVEMGASHPGDIEELVNVAEPDFGLITNVGRAHLQGFGSFEGVKRTKAELYDYLLLHGGKIFLNRDNADLAGMLAEAETRHHCKADTVDYHRIPMPEHTHLVGEYNAENIAAALAVGEYFGVPREEGLQAVRAYVPSNNRSQAMKTERNDLVIDAYNANPSSMLVAINAFHGDTYILGAMRELGDYSRLEHQNLVNMLLERKAKDVYLVGEEYNDTTAPYPVYKDVDALRAFLTEHTLTGRHILIKGSRSNQLEKILDIL
ncbi:MAG: UDP-N-acetylmuramoyl-tripeptide--D-alanyl-D-alanine ligase [Paludibacteraceae bacterium]|nr:UDP-N-acetylmuramoyl-tripeptide--D-alanyl-D-alanine ligase [Paludibacteraceae bacterium]